MGIYLQYFSTVYIALILHLEYISNTRLQKNAIRKIECKYGEINVETMKVIPNYLKRPVIGIERHGRFKELKRPYKISKRLNQTVSLVCYSDSIPESSIGWIRENKIIKNENKFQIVNST